MNQVAGKRNGRVRNVELGNGNGELVARWERKKLGEVCTLRPPKQEVRRRLAETELVSFLPMGDLGIRQQRIVAKRSQALADVYSGYTYFANGDVLLAKITPCFQNGKLGIARNLANGVGFGSTEFFVLRCADEIIPEYLFYFLSRDSFIRDGVARMGGAVGQQRVPPEYVASQKIPLPPLPEQRRIVAILDEAFTGIATARANAERNLRNARAVFESHLEGFFSRRGDEWIEERLEAIADPTCTLSYGIVRPGKEWPDGLPVVRPTDMTTKMIGLDGLKRVKPEVASAYKRTKLVGDELLLCVRGSTGVVAVASKEVEGENVTRGIVPIRFDQSMVQQEFGYYLFRCSHTQNQIRAGTYGAALMQINIRDLRQLRLAFPPLREQARAVRKLDCLSNETQNLQTLYQRKLAALDELKKSLLDRAFSGRL